MNTVFMSLQVIGNERAGMKMGLRKMCNFGEVQFPSMNGLRIFFVLVFLPLFSVKSDERPNVIFILADDLGWADLGCYGNSFHETPHLDKLADEGTRFTQAYAAAPVCSPYRAAFLTGQHPARLGILDYLRPNSANGLSKNLRTLPQVLSENGYATGMVGKWHLTGYKHHEAEFESRPTDYGFHWNVGSEVKGVGNGANTWPYVFREQPIRWLEFSENKLGEDEYLTDRLNAEALDFIEKNAKAKKPFFLYLSHYAPHTILNGRDDLVEKYIRKHPPGKSGRENCYICEDAGLGKGDPGHHWAVDHNPHLAAMLESIDNGVGKICEKLETLGLTENTLVVFTSDNGGESNITTNAPLRGGKSELYEGGIRVPLIMRWPGKLEAGAVSKRVTQNVDFYPSILSGVGIEEESDHTKDGVSIFEAKAQQDLFWHYPLDRPHFLGGRSMGAIRSGDWKLIEHFDSGDLELFDLSKDVSEAKNQVVENPKVSADLKRKLSDWRDSVGATIPSPPLLGEAAGLYFSDHFTPGMVSERLWYGSDWVAENGLLKRVKNGSADTRIFLRDADYQNVVIRFDFKLGQSKDIRLVTGSGGHYNTIVHIRPDHFYLQTAKDNSVPYFSYRHGECAFDFEPDRWYTMTVEFLNNEAVAHIDRQHLVRARHPIIDQPRMYLALQVDEETVEFDDLQVFTMRPFKNEAADSAREKIEAAEGQFPVKKNTQDDFNITRTNAHEWFYQRDEKYRRLVKRVDELDERNRELFPEVYRTHKEYKKAIQDERKRLLKEDPVYKNMLNATHRANREIDAYLIAQKPEVDSLPNSRKKAEISRLHQKYRGDAEYKKLVLAAESAQKKLEADYAQLFVSDEMINQRKKAANEEAKNDPAFKKANDERAAAYRAQQEFLRELEPRIAELEQQLTKK